MSFQSEAFESAAAFLQLICPRERPADFQNATGSHWVASNGSPGRPQGYCVRVVKRDGSPAFDAEVRNVIVHEGSDSDGQYKLVLWPWEDDASGGDSTREIELDIYDDILRVEVY